MGNLSSQFVRALRTGDVDKASELYFTKTQLRECIQPNQSLGSEHHDNTYMHYAAQLGMAHMYQGMIHLKGKPDMKNSQRRNCLHLICSQSSGVRASQVKRDMLELTIKEGLEGMDLKHLLAEKDEDGNTALHLAAGAGLQDCVQLLVSYQADLGATNEDGQTPADLAKARDHGHIATSLEAKMVFSCEEDMAESVEPDSELLEEMAETPVAMQDTDLRSMKDALLIETSQILGVSLQSAEVLLKHYGWSKEDLLQAWLEDSSAVCAGAGVEMPGNSALQDFLGTTTPPLTEGGVCGVEEPLAVECGICCASCEHLQVPCGHFFCRDCWKEYLEGKIEMGETQNISCPQYACYKLVPLEVIESVVSQEMAAKFLSFDIKAFVDSNPNIRWCPHPGCSQAVSRPLLPEDHTHSSPSHSSGEVKGQTVPCGNGHYFCWCCLEDAHEPCSCAQWKRWLEHCNEMKSRVGETTAAEANEAASSKWLVDNSKPCPKCKSPIQKTEGCNHMCCKYCRHDFCWVCLEEWKCHNSSTGGYFNCNRYNAQLQATQYLTERKRHVLKDCKEWEEVSKFIHYHERYKEHIKSYELEEPFLDKAQQKMIELALSIQRLESSEFEGSSMHFSGGNRQLDFTFIQDAVQELLKCRQVLKATYCYGYYLTGIVSKKQFEHMQGALEQVTEMLAEAVARPHMRKPRLEIIRLTREGRVKRVCLVKNVHSGLPLASHPFMDSLQVFGGTGNKNDPRLRRFLRDLDTYTPAQERPFSPADRRHRYKSDTDDDLLRILEESRHEYEADKQMENDLELAKTLSLRLPQPTGDSWLDELLAHTNSGDDISNHTPSWPVLKLNSPPSSLVHPPLQSPHPEHLPLDWVQSPPPWVSDNARVESPPPWVTDEVVHSPTHEARVESPPPQVTDQLGATNDQAMVPSSNDSGAEAELLTSDEHWGPVYGEEEDLLIAIRDSLQEDTSHADEQDIWPLSVGVADDMTIGDSHANNTEEADRDYTYDDAHHETDRDNVDAGRVTDRDCGNGSPVTGDHRKDMLVTGHQAGLKPSTSSAQQLVGYYHHPTSPTHAHGRQWQTQCEDSMLHFSGPQLCGNPVNIPITSSAEERGPLPPQLQQLLDNSERLGTNV